MTSATIVPPRYHTGWGVTRSYQRAFHLYQLAAEQDHARSLTRVAQMVDPLTLEVGESSTAYKEWCCKLFWLERPGSGISSDEHLAACRVDPDYEVGGLVVVVGSGGWWGACTLSHASLARCPCHHPHPPPPVLPLAATLSKARNDKVLRGCDRRRRRGAARGKLVLPRYGRTFHKGRVGGLGTGHHGRSFPPALAFPASPLLSSSPPSSACCPPPPPPPPHPRK